MPEAMSCSFCFRASLALLISALAMFFYWARILELFSSIRAFMAPGSFAR